MSEPRPELETIADAVDALTNPIQTRTRYDYWHGNNRRTRIWTARFPSLLRQLENAKMPGEAYTEDGGHSSRKPGSCPPARLDAINLEYAITAWAADMVWRARRPIRQNTEANLRALVGAYPPQDTVVLGPLRLWHDQARIIAGWALPPLRLKTPCPHCDTPETLRVRLDQQTAACVECRATWNPTTIGLLAEHVRRADGTSLPQHVSTAMIKPA